MSRFLAEEIHGVCKVARKAGKPPAGSFQPQTTTGVRNSGCAGAQPAGGGPATLPGTARDAVLASMPIRRGELRPGLSGDLPSCRGSPQCPPVLPAYGQRRCAGTGRARPRYVRAAARRTRHQRTPEPPGCRRDRRQVMWPRPGAVVRSGRRHGAVKTSDRPAHPPRRPT